MINLGRKWSEIKGRWERFEKEEFKEEKCS